MTFNSFLDRWRNNNLKLLGLSANALPGIQYRDGSCGSTEGRAPAECHGECYLSSATADIKPGEKGSGYQAPPAGIHTGRTIEDLLEQVSRRVDALDRVLAKQEQRRAEIEKELSE